MYILISTILAQQFQLPPGEPLTLPRIYNQFLEPLANFLIAGGIVGAIIVIVWSGIMYFKAGSDSEAKNAKAWFKNGLIGALIILGVGVIINTVALVVTGGFFGFIPGGGGSGGGQQTGTIAPGQPGSVCGSVQTPTGCDPSITYCSPSGICVRNGGNFQGEGCRDNFPDCKTGLRCRGSGAFGTGTKTCQP